MLLPAAEWIALPEESSTRRLSIGDISGSSLEIGQTQNTQESEIKQFRLTNKFQNSQLKFQTDCLHLERRV